MHKAPFLFPIIGGHSAEQLAANLEALDISLTDAQLAYIDGVLLFDKGFPNNFIVRSSSSSSIYVWDYKDICLANTTSSLAGRIWRLLASARALVHV